MPKTNVFWFSFYDSRSPSTRYRGKYLLDTLESDKQVNCFIFYPSWRFSNVIKFCWIWLFALLRSSNNSTVVIQRVYSNRAYAKALKLLVFLKNKRSFYDLDDAEYLENDPISIEWFLRNCSGALVGSEALKDYALQFNSNVNILTSAVTNHGVVKTQKNETLRVGWIGNFLGMHERNYYEVFLKGISQLKVNIELVIIGICCPVVEDRLRNYLRKSKNVKLIVPRVQDWNNEEEIYRELANCDIGLSPLLDNELNRCKSAYKMKQFLSCGIPVLASPVGENSNFLINKVNGFICKNDSEFMDKITFYNQLNPQEYEKWKENILMRNEDFSIDKVSKQFLEYTAV